MKKKTPVFQKTFITRSKAQNEADAQSDEGTADECSVCFGEYLDDCQIIDNIPHGLETWSRDPLS